MAENKETDWLYNSMQATKREVDAWPSWQRAAMGISTREKDKETTIKTTVPVKHVEAAG